MRKLQNYRPNNFIHHLPVNEATYISNFLQDDKDCCNPNYALNCCGVMLQHLSTKLIEMENQESMEQPKIAFAAMSNEQLGQALEFYTSAKAANPFLDLLKQLLLQIIQKLLEQLLNQNEGVTS